MYDWSVLERMLRYIGRHDLMRPGDRVGVAVSGGADSVALLRLLLEAREQLGIVLSVVHFNHKIRGAEADADEQFVRELAAQYDLEFLSESVNTPAYAAEHKLSLEAAGRELRYKFFDQLTGERNLERVATAHTRDDQAETVLLRFLRGSGTRGLAGIYPGVGGWISISVTSSFWKHGESSPPDPIPLPLPSPAPRIIRPLLDISRAELRAYLKSIGQDWREDASNLDVNFTRNRLRHEVMPLLRQINPNLDETLSETAEIAREEESWWEGVVANTHADLFGWSPRTSAAERRRPKLKLEALRKYPLAVQRRVLRLLGLAHGLRLEFQHVQQLLDLAMDASAGVKRIELPQDMDAIRAGQELWLETRCQQEDKGYDLSLAFPGKVEVRQAGIVVSASTSTMGDRLELKLARDLRVRNWRPGDRYWPAHTSGPKKVKELLQERHIPRRFKANWPVVVSGDQIVWVPGFPVAEEWRVREEGIEGLLLSHVPLRQ